MHQRSKNKWWMEPQDLQNRSKALLMQSMIQAVNINRQVSKQGGYGECEGYLTWASCTLIRTCSTPCNWTQKWAGVCFPWEEGLQLSDCWENAWSTRSNLVLEGGVQRHQQALHVTSHGTKSQPAPEEWWVVGTCWAPNGWDNYSPMFGDFLKKMTNRIETGSSTACQGWPSPPPSPSANLHRNKSHQENILNFLRTVLRPNGGIFLTSSRLRSLIFKDNVDMDYNNIHDDGKQDYFFRYNVYKALEWWLLMGRKDTSRAWLKSSFGMDCGEQVLAWNLGSRERYLDKTKPIVEVNTYDRFPQRGFKPNRKK